MINNQLVVKSNKLIQASYRLTLTEQRIILYAIAKFRKQNRQIMATDKIVVDPYEFAELYDINPRFVYAALKEATNDLFKREVTIYETDPTTGKDISIQTRWIWERGYSDELNYSHIKFSPRVIGYFHNLEKSFTKYSIQAIANLNSIYAVRLYELLKQFEQVKYRDITISDLRNLFQLEDEYQIFADFKKRVIDKSIKQINTSTDIKVSYIQIKRGRNVIGFKFSIDRKKVTKKQEEQQRKIALDTPEQSPSVIKQEQTLETGRLPTQEELNQIISIGKSKKVSQSVKIPSFRDQPIPIPLDEQ